MSVISGQGRSSPQARKATLAWTATGALATFTLAAMLSIGIFLLIPTVLAVVFAAKRFGTAGMVAGLPLGAAVTVAVLTVLVVSSNSPSSGGGFAGPS